MSLRVLGSGKQCSKLMIHSLIVRALTAARSSTRCRPWEINSGDESWRRPRKRGEREMNGGRGEDGWAVVKKKNALLIIRACRRNESRSPRKRFQ